MSGRTSQGRNLQWDSGDSSWNWNSGSWSDWSGWQYGNSWWQQDCGASEPEAQHPSSSSNAPLKPDDHDDSEPGASVSAEHLQKESWPSAPFCDEDRGPGLRRDLQLLGGDRSCAGDDPARVGNQPPPIAASATPAPPADVCAATQLEQYLATLRCDSFTHALQSERDWFKRGWLKQAKDKFTACIVLPPMCAVRKHADSSARDSLHGAKDEAANEAISLLKQNKQLDEVTQAPLPLPVAPVLPADFPTVVEGMPKDSEGDILMELAECRGNAAAIYKVEVVATEGEDTDPGLRFGFVASVHAQFSYQIREGGSLLRIEVVAELWDPRRLDAVSKFHTAVTGRKARGLAGVVLQGAAIDVEAMASFVGGGAKAPAWLPRLLRRTERLLALELQIGAFAPTVPAPNPMKLDVILACDDPGAQEARRALAVVGRAALKQLASVAVYSANPWDSADRLQKRLEAITSPVRLAVLMRSSGLMAVAMGRAKSPEHLEEMLAALIGGYFIEVDFFAVSRLWQWLLSVEEGADVEELVVALRHLGGCPPYLGRTTSYKELWEQEEDGSPQLLVRYVESDDAQYRCTGKAGEERRPELPDPAWLQVVWDANLGAFCSPSMLEKDGQHKPLPNKVSAWLRGRPKAALTRIKHYDGSTPAYVELRELRSGELHVRYREFDWIAYKRAEDGGLGFECKVTTDGEEHEWFVLGFSEENKTLLSACMRGRALPNRVVEWVRGVRSLAQLIPVRKKDDDKDNTITTNDVATWTCDSVRYYCHAEAALGGGVYTAIDEVRMHLGHEWQELVYSEEKKEWYTVSDTSLPEDDPRSKPVAVPPKAMAWIVRDLQELRSLEEFSARHVQAPWLQAPSFARTFFPRISGMGLAEVEQALGHKFRNPLLLAEALTHASTQAATTPSCERLAFVGEAAAQAVISSLLLRQAAFSTAATITRDGTVMGAEVFAAPRGLAAWKQGKVAPATECPACESVDEMETRMLIYCNHTTYARTSVRIGLHMALQVESKDLKASIARFAKRDERTRPAEGAKPGDGWKEVLAKGAPRALGDVFLACVGAVVLDGEHTEADLLLQRHMKECSDINPKELGRRLPELSKDRKEVRWEHIAEALQQAGTSICKEALAPRPPDALGNDREKEQLARALAFTDVHVVHCKDGQIAGGSSPRAARLGLAVRPTCGLVIDKPEVPLAAEAHEDSEGSAAAGDALQPSGDPDGPMYCRQCEMWLNGPTQWWDHVIGKKHQKAVHRSQPTGCLVKGAEDQPPPPPPPPPVDASTSGQKADRRRSGRQPRDKLLGLDPAADAAAAAIKQPPPGIWYRPPEESVQMRGALLAELVSTLSASAEPFYWSGNQELSPPAQV